MNLYVEDIKQELKALGNTADEIADSLRQLGITGNRDGYKSCPLFHFLERKGFQVQGVSYCDVDLETTEVTLPEACIEFIKEFDSGNYSFLAKEREN